MIQTLTNFNLLINNGQFNLSIFIFTIIFLLYIFITLYLTYLIYSAFFNNKKKNKINYISLIKDKDFIFFKNSLFKLYGSILTILFIFLFKDGELIYLLKFNHYLILFLSYLVLISNWFTLFLFRFYFKFKTYSNILNDIHFYTYNSNEKFVSTVFPLAYSHNLRTQARKFSTKSYGKSNEPDLDNLTYKSDISLWKKKHQRDFKKAYGGGFLGYDYIYNFGLVSNIIGTADTSKLQLDEDIHKAHEELNLFLNKNRLEKIENLKFKLKDYIYVLPETETWSILPVVRWESSVDQYQSFSISESIKITKDIDINLLADTLVWDLTKIIDEYSLKDADLELYIMGRPWLSVDEFDLDRFIDRKSLSDLFNEVLEKKLLSYNNSLIEQDSSDKISGLKNYLFKNVYMDNYGDPVLDLNSNLIGYKLYNNQYVSIKTYYNNENLLCNKVSIRDFDNINLSFKPYILR